jgi:hypothetical protein
MDKGFLHLTTPEEMFEKLKHDFKLIEEDENDTYKAFNFFVTAEHLPDWVGDKRIKDNNPYLRISSHLATGAKHFVVTSKKNSIESCGIDVYVDNGYVKNSYIKTVLVLKLTINEAKEISADSISVLSLAEQVLSFWSNYFASKNIT